MQVYSVNFGFVLFAFPGILFTIFSIIFWLFLGNFILQKIDRNPTLNLTEIVKGFFVKLAPQPIIKAFSKGALFLYSKIIALFLVQTFIFYDFFGSKQNSAYAILLILLIALVFEVLYQLELTSNILIFAGKIFAEIIIIISLGLMLYNQGQTSFYDLSISLTKQSTFFSIFLFILIIFAISKLSSYMDYKKVPVFQITPNDLFVYKSKIENANNIENATRWLSETYLQIIYSQLLVLITFPLILESLALQGPTWIEMFLFIVFQVSILLLALFLNLLSSTLEFKIPSQGTKSVLFVLLLISLLVFY